MKKCDFCEEYEYLRSQKKKVKDETGCNMHLRASIIEYWTRDSKTVSLYAHKKHRLRFCPSCGKKLIEMK